MSAHKPKDKASLVWSAVGVDGRARVASGSYSTCTFSSSFDKIDGYGAGFNPGTTTGLRARRLLKGQRGPILYATVAQARVACQRHYDKSVAAKAKADDAADKLTRAGKVKCSNDTCKRTFDARLQGPDFKCPKNALYCPMQSKPLTPEEEIEGRKALAQIIGDITGKCLNPANDET